MSPYIDRSPSVNTLKTRSYITSSSHLKTIMLLLRDPSPSIQIEVCPILRPTWTLMGVTLFCPSPRAHIWRAGVSCSRRTALAPVALSTRVVSCPHGALSRLAIEFWLLAGQAFHVFKIFVANPNKGREVHELLLRNKVTFWCGQRGGGGSAVHGFGCSLGVGLT